MKVLEGGHAKSLLPAVPPVGLLPLPQISQNLDQLGTYFGCDYLQKLPIELLCIVTPAGKCQLSFGVKDSRQIDGRVYFWVNKVDEAKKIVWRGAIACQLGWAKLVTTRPPPSAACMLKIGNSRRSKASNLWRLSIDISTNAILAGSSGARDFG